MRHANFLPPKLTPGEARELGLRYIAAEDRAPIRDESSKLVSRSRWEHVPVEEQVNPVQLVEQQEETEADPNAKMVTRRKMTVNRFLPGFQSSTEPQQPQGKG